ncbi:hypothetical protein, partial [Sphingomonas sp. PP-CE-3G-477]|uniref:hypothetical protein n=1 Tax=Sphingomonas sp. PP-CE-3G-477 TaxID=2135660 RepID=UPI001C6302ED
RHGEFLSLKELHRLPPLPQDQTSERLRYLTAATTAAQRLRAVGPILRLIRKLWGKRACCSSNKMDPRRSAEFQRDVS